MAVRICSNQGIAMLCYSLIIFILIGMTLHIEPADSNSILIAIVQALATILVLGLMVMYNHMQFLDRLIIETENRIFEYMNEVIGWFYPVWKESTKEIPIERHIEANINADGFSKTYFQLQLKRHLSTIFIDIERDLGKDAVWRKLLTNKEFNSSIVWDKEKGEVNKEETGRKIANYLVNYYEEHYECKDKDKMISETKNKIIRRIGEVNRQKDRLKRGIELRKYYKDEFDSITKYLKAPIITMITAIIISIIHLLLIAHNGDSLHWRLNTLIITIVITIGLFSIIWLIINMYSFIIEHKSIQLQK